MTWLLDQGADVNRSSKAGQTALHNVCVKGQFEVALELQRRGGDLDARTKEEVTLLHLAAYMAGHIF